MKHLKKFNENSSYPTLGEVPDATPEQIMSWQRFLPSPSNKEEVEVINQIFTRYKELSDRGKINSSTSKSVGW